MLLNVLLDLALSLLATAPLTGLRLDWFRSVIFEGWTGFLGDGTCILGDRTCILGVGICILGDRTCVFISVMPSVGESAGTEDASLYPELGADGSEWRVMRGQGGGRAPLWWNAVHSFSRSRQINS